MSLIAQALAGAGQGLASAPANASPFESLAMGFAGSYGAANAARQAAEQYAQRKLEAEQAQEERQLRQGLIEAQTERLKRPEPPKEPKRTIADDIRDAEVALGRKLTEKELQIKLGIYKEPKEPTKPEKPKVVPTRIPATLHKTEADLLREISWSPSNAKEVQALPAFIQHLTDIMTGRAEYDSPDLRRAAQMRLNEIQGQRR